MNKIIFIFLSTFLSLTIISCAKKDDSSSSSSSSGTTTTTTTTTTPNACPAKNWWQLMEGSNSRNLSLVGNSKLSRHSEQGGGRVLYVDQAALSQYQKRDNYLLFDPFDADINYPYVMKGHPHGNTIWQSGNDQVDLSANAPVLSDNFTLEAWVYSDNITLNYHYRSIMGSEQGVNAANIFNNDTSPTISYIKGFGAEGITYGFGTGSKKIKFHTSVNIPVKVWHHIATTFDGNNYILYMNGEVLDNKTVTAGDSPAATPVRYIGTDFMGKIDEVRMWSVARTQSEIQANMNKTLEDNATGMAAYYPMAVNNNYSMIIDNSSNANHAYITKATVGTRYFSDNSSCSNGPDGTTSCPYPTILSAVDDAQPGDHIYIREGRYSESLAKWQLNHSYERVENNLAKEGPKIVIEGYPNEEVILDGTVAINAIWDNYTNASIYYRFNPRFRINNHAFLEYVVAIENGKNEFGWITESEIRNRLIRNSLIKRGLYESVTFSFLSEKDLKIYSDKDSFVEILIFNKKNQIIKSISLPNPKTMNEIIIDKNFLHVLQFFDLLLHHIFCLSINHKFLTYHFSY